MPIEKSDVERLFEQLEAHEKEEAESLDAYEAAATASPDAGVRYLMGLVLEDERRHHRLLQAMSEEIRQSLLWLNGTMPLPDIKPANQARQMLLHETERFLRIERRGLRQLEDLHTQVKHLHSGLLELIVELMQADTRKHQHILEYIHKRLQDGWEA